MSDSGRMGEAQVPEKIKQHPDLQAIGSWGQFDVNEDKYSNPQSPRRGISYIQDSGIEDILQTSDMNGTIISPQKNSRAAPEYVPWD